MHAVGGRAVDVAKAIGRRVHIQRRMQRQRIRFGAVVVLGRHHLHLGQILERFIQRDDARRLVTVVVGDEDFH